MDTQILPDAIEPTYWNVVFHPSETRLNRILLGRFQHVSAFTYVPGFRAWLMYDAQWRGTRLLVVSERALEAYIGYMRDCAIVKFDRADRHPALPGRLVFFGFYCVPAIKSLLGLSCVAATPDALYRHLINNGGILINGIDHSSSAAAAAARSNVAAGTATGTG